MPRTSGLIFSEREEKPSSVLPAIVSAVARIIATTQGRTPDKKACTPEYFKKLRIRAAIIKMITKDGRTTPRVAAAAPARPACEEPIKVAMLTASGPGVDSDTAIKFRKSDSESQPYCRTFSRISEIMP